MAARREDHGWSHQQRGPPLQGPSPACAGTAPGVGVGFRGVLGRRRRREARPEDLRDGAGGGGGRGAGGGAPHRRQHEQGLRAGAGSRDARAAAGQVRDRRRGEMAPVRRAGAPGPRLCQRVARRGPSCTHG